MAGALKEDTARTLASGRQTVGSVLSAAQAHLKRVFLVFVAVMLGTLWALRAFIWDRLEQDLVLRNMDVETQQATEIVVVTPFDVILLQVKIGLIAGILASIPVLVWYGRDGLKERGYWPSSTIPRWKLWAFGISILGLFLGGVAYAYLLFFPIMFDFLASNAVMSGFDPTWSIVMWTEFIFFLTLSFGMAAQLPLAMSSLARTGIVPYETFRDKWRYAVVGIFVFGAVFSPPDPFTQVMWGVPLVALYGVSLGITKLAVLSQRAGQQVPVRTVAREYWNHLAGTFLVVAVLLFVYLTDGGLEATNDLLGAVGSRHRFPATGDLATLGLSHDVISGLIAALVGLIAAGIVLFVLRIKVLEREMRAAETGVTGMGSSDGVVQSTGAASPGERATMNIGNMPTQAIRSAPVDAFLALSEEEVLDHAEVAVEENDPEKARAIFERYDEAEAEQEAREEGEAEGEEGESVAASTAAGMMDPFTEGETTEDDIGGYYYDIRFIFDSLTSKAMWLVATFMVVLAGSFLFLYTGGIREVTEIFLQNMPAGTMGEVSIVTLHPVEALIFMLKFSTLLAILSVVPILLYFAWPAVQERGLSTGNRDVLLVWGGTMFVTIVGGTLLGFLFIAPTVISALAADVITSQMIIAYRIHHFGWLVVYLTVGVGILTMVPATMVLFHHGDIITYPTMVRAWRGVVLGFFAGAAFFSPQGVFTMFILAIPLTIAYFIGLGLLWMYTRVERLVPGRRTRVAE